MNLEVRDLTFKYPEGDLIFKGFNIAPSSSIVVLKGPSGCGKTTLLKLIMGLLQPDKGNITFKMQNSGKVPEGEIKMYYISQDIALFPWLTGYQNLLLNNKITVQSIVDNKLFPYVEDFIEKKCYQMSFGQRRKLELLRAILSEPDVFLLDEPLNFIDRKGRKAYGEYFNFLVQEKGKLIVITSHYDEEQDFEDCDVYKFSGEFPVKELENVKIN